MKAYILTEKDFEFLLTKLDRNPNYGLNGGSSAVFNSQEEQAFRQAHKFYNYQVRMWLDEVKK